MPRKADQPEPADAPPPVDDLSYEDAIEELEALIEQIESGEIGLEASIRKYDRGTRLLKRCRSILGRAEQRIEELDADALDRAAEGDEGA